MSEDKRIKKTKKILKENLILLLEKKTFEQVTVKEICEESDTSRVTFYTHYNDKYELADDIFKDMIQIAMDDYYRLQKENNPHNDFTLRYCNLMDCILNMYYGQFRFFSHTVANESPYLNFSFYKYALQYVEFHVRKHSEKLFKYSPKKISGFLCYGLWGFLNESQAEKNSLEQVRAELQEIVKDLFKSKILTFNV